MTEYTSSIANMLRTLAYYLEMAEGKPKVRIGVQFKLKNRPVVKIPVMPVDQFSATLGSWASQEIVKTVKEYQRVTGKTDGQDIIDQFTQAGEYLGGLTKT